MRKIIIFAGIALLPVLFMAFAGVALTEEGAVISGSGKAFKGRVNSSGINIRFDATTGSGVICKVDKGEILEVVLERYDWYKVRLPKAAPCFIKKNMVSLLEDRIEATSTTDVHLLDNQTETLKVNPDFSAQTGKLARVAKERVNLRLSPGESAAILGRIDKDELVTIIAQAGAWYRIEPPKASYGWIHKRFIESLPEEKVKAEAGRPAVKIKEENTVVTGVLKPYGKVFFRRGTHKLVTQDNKIFLLKSSHREQLDALNYHMVRVGGRIIPGKNNGPALLEIEKIEALD